MLLSASEIASAVENKEILIDPFSNSDLRPSSIRIHLGSRAFRLKSPDHQVFRVNKDNPNAVFEPYNFENGSEISISPGEFILVETKESISLPAPYFAFVSTLSSLARIGIDVIQSSFLIQSGYGVNQPSTIALELTSSTIKIAIPIGFPVGQLMISKHCLDSDFKEMERYTHITSLIPDYDHLMTD